MPIQNNFTPSHHPDGESPRPRLIVAEDDADALDALQSLFTNDGFDVTCARDGEELVCALERARDSSRFPYVVITDHQMPGYTGVEVTLGLRDNGWPVPIIILTAFKEEIDEIGMRAGADAVLPKPVNIDNLRQVVWLWVRERSEQAPSSSE